jgi:sugar-specific transcriptional regulator TrmB
MFKQKLIKLGFTNNLATVYTALIDLGKSRGSDIAVHTKLHRSVVYNELDELIERGLVSKTKTGSCFLFQANNPEYLVDEVKQKQLLAQSVLEDIKDRQKEAPTKIAVLEGLDAYKKFKNKSLELEEGDTVHIISAANLNVVSQEMDSFWLKHHRRRANKKINAKFLFDNSTDSKAVVFREELDNTEIKYLPFNTDLPFWFEILGDKVGIGVPSKEPYLFTIESEDVAKAFKNFFDYFWKQETKTYMGWDEIKKLFFSELMVGTDKDETELIIGSNDEFIYDKQYVEFFEKYYELIVEKKLNKECVFNQEYNEQLDDSIRGAHDPFYKIIKVKYLNNSDYRPEQVHVFKNKCIVIHFDIEPVAVVYSDKKIVDKYKKKFKKLWEKAMLISLVG